MPPEGTLPFHFCASTITHNIHGSLLTESPRKDLAKPYDPHKAVWTPDGNGGFTEGIMQVRILQNLTSFPNRLPRRAPGQKGVSTQMF